MKAKKEGKIKPGDPMSGMDEKLLDADDADII